MTSIMTVTPLLPSPSSNGAVTTPAGGSWAADTGSLVVAGWWSPDGAETDLYYCAVDRSGLAAWNNITTLANDKVVVPIAHGQITNATIPVFPHHYSLYAQGADTADFSLPWVKVQQWDDMSLGTDPNGTIITANDDTTLATVTFGTSGPSFTLSKCIGLTQHEDLPQVERAHNLALMPLSLSQRLPLLAITWEMVGESCTRAQYDLLLKFKSGPIRCKLDMDQTGSDAALNEPIKTYYGYFVGMPNIGAFEQENIRIPIVFAVDHAIPDDSVPVLAP